MNNWIETGLSFDKASEAGKFLLDQGFSVCAGGFEKKCEISGAIIFASYVLTNNKCYIRLCEVNISKDKDGWIVWEGGACPIDGLTKVLTRWDDGDDDLEGSPAMRWRWEHWDNLEAPSLVAYKIIG